MATAWSRDTGLFAKMFSDVLADIQRIPKPADRANVPLTLNQLLPCFFLFLGGILLSVLAHCLERVAKRPKGKVAIPAVASVLTTKALTAIYDSLEN